MYIKEQYTAFKSIKRREGKRDVYLQSEQTMEETIY
jgi:hypothetical protein